MEKDTSEIQPLQDGKIDQPKAESAGGLDSPYTTFVTAENVLRKDGFYKTVIIPSTSAATASNYGHFFTAHYPCEVIGVSEVHKAVGSAANLDVRKDLTGASMGGGNSVLATSFSVASTANTPVFKTGSDLSASGINRRLNKGDRLSLKLSVDSSGLEHVLVTVYFKYLGRGDYRVV